MQLTEAWTTKWWTTNIVWGKKYFYSAGWDLNPPLSPRWNSYETNLLSTFEGLLDSEALSDVTLFCEGKSASVMQWLCCDISDNR